MLDTYLDLLELAYYEAKFAFEGLEDDDVWTRPAEGVLSIGELAGHVSYWLALRFAGDGEDLAKCKVSSPLIDPRFRYYYDSLTNPPTDEQLELTADQVCKEFDRIHKEAVEAFRSQNPDLGSPAPGTSWEWSVKETLKYTIFHVSYHAGQMYTVRHLMGDRTADN